jgi:hypothetical protein
VTGEDGVKRVMTKDGLAARDSLHVWLEVGETTSNSIDVATVWFPRGDLNQAHVRRDALCLQLASQEMQAQFANFEGQMVVPAPPLPAPADVTIKLNGHAAGIEQSQIG